MPSSIRLSKIVEFTAITMNCKSIRQEASEAEDSITHIKWLIEINDADTDLGTTRYHLLTCLALPALAG